MIKKYRLFIQFFFFAISYDCFSQNLALPKDTTIIQLTSEKTEKPLNKIEKKINSDSIKPQKIMKIIVDGKEINPSVEIKKTPKLNTDLLPPPLPEKNSLSEKIRITDSINLELKNQELLAKEKIDKENTRIADSLKNELLTKQEQLANEKSIAENKLLAEAEAKRLAEKQAEEQNNKIAKEAENALLESNQKEDSIAKAQKELLNEQPKTTVPKLENNSQQPLKKVQNPNDNIAKDNIYGKVRLFYDSLSASFLLTIPTETKMHFHESHSEHILLIEGDGIALIGYKTHTLKKNDLIFIPKGTPHKIINTGKNPIKILSIQAPFFDWADHNIIE